MDSKLDVKDFEWAVGLNRVSLDLIGVWPRDGNNRNFIQVAMEIFFILLCVVMPQTHSLILSRGDLDLTVQNLLTNVECSTSLLKVFILWYNKEAMMPILKTLASDWQRMSAGWHQEIMYRVGKQGRMLTIYGYFFLACTLGAFAILPAVGFRLRSELVNVTNLNNRILPLPSHYPYDLSASPYFEFCYLSQVICSGIVTICFTSPVSLFGVFVFHVCGQIEIICTELNNLNMITSAKNKNSRSAMNRDWRAQLGKIITKHNDIIMTVRNIESYFNLLVITQVISLPITLGIIGLRIMNALGSNNGITLTAVEIVVIVATLSNVLLHIFIYCLVGETLAYHSERLYSSVYGTKWYAYSERNAKNLIPMMVRTKDPLRLTAGKYIFLNFETFCNILKTVAGYVSMLVAVVNK